MPFHLMKIAALILLLGLCGCRSVHRENGTLKHAGPAPTGKKSIDIQTRNNAIALLNDLLNEEKNLSKILIIKRESPDLKRLVKDISETADDGAKMLKSLAKKDRGIQLATLGLPPGEVAARQAISKTKQDLLLHTKGAEFEFQLLLTQMEALSYGTHLALVAAENEPQPERAQEFSKISGQLKQLEERVLTRLRPKA
jgi:hypothetical protein